MRTRVLGTCALAAIAALVSTWALATARYGGPDEPAHVVRAAAVARGELGGNPSDALAPGFRVVSVPAELATGDPICFRRQPTLGARCSASRAVEGSANVGTAAGVYPPAYYVIVGLPVRLIGEEGSSGAYRLVAGALNALVLALVTVRARRLGRPALLVAAGLPPAACFLFGVVNPNGLEIALTLLAWVGVARLAPTATVRSLLWVAIPAAAAVVIRPVALLPVLAVTVAATVLVERWTWRSRLVIWAPVAVATLSVAAWNRWIGLEFTDPRTAEETDIASAMWTSIKDIPTTLREAVGALSWNELSAPWPALVLWTAVAATLIGIVWTRGGRRLRLAVAVWATALLLGPVAFEVAARERVGFIWQGRYSISTLVGLGSLAAIAVASDGRRRSRPRRAPPPPPPPSPSIVLAAAALAEAIAFWATLRRYTVGTDGSWWFAADPARTDVWEPALAPQLLLGAHVLVLVLMVLAVSRTLSTTRRSSRTRPR